jgi:geranylgeranyl diphosphate synthase type II
LDVATASQKTELNNLIKNNAADKIEKVLQIFSDCKVAAWATSLKEKYYTTALKHLEDLPVQQIRKIELINLAAYLLERES